MIDKSRLLREGWRTVCVYSPHVFLAFAGICLFLYPRAAFGGGASPVVTGVSPAGGPAGTSVTITGTSFNNATVVDFGNVSAAFTYVSSTEITATVPSGFSGSVNVTVTVLFSGTSATNPDDIFTLSAPVISAPALSQWSMMALGLLLAGLGCFALRRKFA
jgi:IPT/TIG domain/IPTL-CTERM motif